jgi:hypothetical protein
VVEMAVVGKKHKAKKVELRQSVIKNGPEYQIPYVVVSNPRDLPQNKKFLCLVGSLLDRIDAIDYYHSKYNLYPKTMVYLDIKINPMWCMAIRKLKEVTV